MVKRHGRTTVALPRCVSMDTISNTTSDLIAHTSLVQTRRLPRLECVDWQYVFAASSQLCNDYPHHVCSESDQSVCAQFQMNLQVVKDAVQDLDEWRHRHALAPLRSQFAVGALATST